MTQTQLLFLQAAKAALRGKQVDWAHMEPEQWQELMELAREELKGFTLSEEERRYYGVG